jgi:CHAT domain-containing protein
MSGPLSENPLLRSGLALAGAQTWLDGGALPPEAGNGLLTAEDVTGLDLLDTELVVLSACETGLGEVQVGEGVFGLRRAFVLAGAKTLVMSLWKVPDEETRELMENFYRRVLAGEPRAEALQNAQLAMKAKYPHPFFWGAFICQGNPGPLPPIRPGGGSITSSTRSRATARSEAPNRSA